MTNPSTAERRSAQYLAASAVTVFLLLATVLTVVNASNQTTPSSASALSSWDADIFHLPADVAFPGSGWLDRIASPNTVYTVDSVVNGTATSTTYSSVYDAMLHGEPLTFPCRNFNAYINSIILPNEVARYVVDHWAAGNTEWGHYLLCYLRNLVGSIIVYYGIAGIFHYFCYVHPIAHETFEKAGRDRPSSETIWDQIKLAQSSMFIYVLLPVIDEFVIEQGWTQAYFTVQEIGGLGYYFLSMVVYFAAVEVGIYWVHRTLHTNKFMYKHIHLLHHKYNRPETLTPWASIAFHPVDGMMQASPYVLMLPFFPCHYLTHFVLLFFTAVWATYIHDAMDWNIGPIMGSKYHTVHHTHYIYNYGQVFVFCDKIWGTYREPEGPTGLTGKRNPKKTL